MEEILNRFVAWIRIKVKIHLSDKLVYFREGEEGEHIDISFYCYSQESIGQIINNGEKETLGLGGIESGYGNVIFNSSVIFFGNPVCGYFRRLWCRQLLRQ